MAAVRAKRGDARSPRALAFLLVGIEVLAVGAWFVLKWIEVHDETWWLGVYAAAAGFLGITLWAVLGRGTAAAARTRVVRQRVHQDRETRAALLRLDKMDPVRLGDHVVGLCRRDGLAEVSAVRVHDDAHAVDVTGLLPGGRRLVVRCRSAAGAGIISGSIVERLVTAELYADAAPAMIVATTAGSFSPKARAVAAAADVTLVDRRALARWDQGLETPEPLDAATEPEGTPNERV